MASKVDIFNLALSNLGHKATIADPDEASVEASHCRRFYPMALGVTLERYAWSFATQRAALAEVDNPVDHWTYAYGVPALCVRARAVLLPESTDDTLEQPFEIEATEDDEAILYCNVENAVLKYTKYVDNTTKFSPLFVMALAHDLAAMLVGPIPKDPRRRQEQQQLAAYYTSQAQAADANASHSTSYADHVPFHLAVR